MTDAWDRPAGPEGRAAGSRPGSDLLDADEFGGRAARRRPARGGRPEFGQPEFDESESGRSESGRSEFDQSGFGRREFGPPRRRRSGAVPALVLILVPLVAALVGNGQGVVFWAGSLVGATAAAWLCSIPGVWWVATSTPPVVLLMSVAGLVVGDSSAAATKLGTDLAKVVAGAFPVMAVALVCAVVVGVGRTLSARKAKGNGRG